MQTDYTQQIARAKARLARQQRAVAETVKELEVWERLAAHGTGVIHDPGTGVIHDPNVGKSTKTSK